MVELCLGENYSSKNLKTCSNVESLQKVLTHAVATMCVRLSADRHGHQSSEVNRVTSVTSEQNLIIIRDIRL